MAALATKSRSSMAKTKQKLSGPGKRRVAPGNGQNKWDYDQKLTLRLLFVDFGLTSKDATAVFNKLYADHLNSCGCPNGIAIGSITSQYGERNKSNASKDWITICNETTDPEQVMKRRTISDQIDDILASLRSDQYSSAATPTPQTLSAGPQTPSVSTKRTRSVSRLHTVEIGDEDDNHPPQAKRQRRSIRDAVVVIPKAEQERAIRSLRATSTEPPVTPKKRARSSSQRRLDASVSYKLPSGTEIWLTPKEFKETQADLVPLAEALARPYVPLLFRYSTPECQSPLTRNGFLAGRFATTIIPPPPPPSLQQFPWSCAAQHLNRDQKIASPFISTSNNFVWIIKLALKERKRGAKGGLITLINPRMLGEGSVFHAQPVHRELCKKRPFDNAAFMYHGLHKFLVWSTIPKDALISTFPIDMLLDFAKMNESVGTVMRLEQLSQHRTGYHSKILPAFRAQNVTLEAGSFVVIAQVCKALGLDISMIEAVGSVVTDVIKGYGLVLENKTARQWLRIANVFCQEISRNSNVATLAEMAGIKYAFLDACRWATGDFNARQKPRNVQTMLGRAKKIGIESPAQILMLELNDAKASIMQYNKVRQTLLCGSASRALLAEPDEDVDQIIPAATHGWKRIASSTSNRGEGAIEMFGSHNDAAVISDVLEEDSDGSVYEI